jgi:hypothetical protein
VLVAVVISVMAGWRICSHCSICYLSPWQRVRRWVRRGPHAEWPGSVSVPGAALGVCVNASMDPRDRRSCTCSLRMIVAWWRSLGGLLVPAVGCASAWHSVGDSSAGGGRLFSLLSQLVGVVVYACECVCFVQGVFVW